MRSQLAVILTQFRFLLDDLDAQCHSRHMVESSVERRQIAELMVRTIVETAHEEEQRDGPQAASDLIEYVMQELTATIVYSAIVSGREHSDFPVKMQAEASFLNVEKSRAMIERAISNGFAEAYYAGLGRVLTYSTKVDCVDVVKREGSLH